MKAAAGNGDLGGKSQANEVMQLLLQHEGAEVVISDQVMKAAAGNWDCGKNIMQLLLQYQEAKGAEVVISDKIMKAAAGNSRQGKEVIMLLLEQRMADVVITEEVVMAAATCGQEKILQIIEKHFKISPPKEQWSIARFYTAVMAAEENVIRKLLKDGVEPDLKGFLHVSPLWVAATYGRLRTVQILLETHNFDVNSKSGFGGLRFSGPRQTDTMISSCYCYKQRRILAL